MRQTHGRGEWRTKRKGLHHLGPTPGAGEASEGEVSIKKDARWERIRAQALELAASGKFRYWHPIEVALCKTFPANEVRFAFDPEMRVQLDAVCKVNWTK